MKPLEIVSKAAVVLAVIFVGGCTVVLIGPILVLVLFCRWLRRFMLPFARWDD